MTTHSKNSPRTDRISRTCALLLMAACFAWTTTACSESPSSTDTGKSTADTSTADTTATDTNTGSDADTDSPDTTDDASPDTDDGGSMDTEAGTPNGDASDADTEFGGDCEAISDEFDRVIAANNSCTTDDDCVQAAVPGAWCDCGRILSGVVNKGASQRTQDLQDQYAQCTDAQEVCDVAPYQNIRCEEGKCVGDSGSCFGGDAG